MRLFFGFFLAGYLSSAAAAEWGYTIKYDSFEGIEVKSALLLGQGKGLNLLSLSVLPSGQKTLTVYASKIECFRSCLLRVKFDDSKPEDFVATSSKPISYSVKIEESERFIRRLFFAKTIVFRMPFYDYSKDVIFEQGKALDSHGWEEARQLQEIKKFCQDNAIGEDYEICLSKITTK